MPSALKTLQNLFSPRRQAPELPPMSAEAAEAVTQAISQPEEKRQNFLDDFWYGPIQRPVSSGVNVTESSSLSVGAILACVRVLSETAAQLPRNIIERSQKNDRDARLKAIDHPLYRAFHIAPNEEMDAFQWTEFMISDMILWGHSYSQRLTDNVGRLFGFQRLEPWRLTPDMDESGQVFWRYKPAQGAERIFFRDDLFIVAGPLGKSVIQLQRESIGLSMAAERNASAFFGNGARISMAMEIDGKLTPEARKQLHDDLKKYQGPDNAGKWMVLENGSKVHPLIMPLNDAQFLESRKYQRTEIAGMLRVPPHLIGDLEHATFSNIEEQGINFVTYSLMPWLRRIEIAAEHQLLDSPRYTLEFNVNGLLRGNVEQRGQFYASMLQNAVMTRNQVRELENLNPAEGDMMDSYTVQLNMTDIEALPAPRDAEPTGTEEEGGGEGEREIVSLAERDRLLSALQSRNGNGFRG